jgi:hypothetical protein
MMLDAAMKWSNVIRAATIYIRAILGMSFECRDMYRSDFTPTSSIYMLWVLGDKVLRQEAKSEPRGVI